ncbi:MAG: PSD1 domain-containing protein [Planctomycetaceae bacterium]|nr:PSD1 domain-containing protein [Planctomycetaceae bacterium]
MIERVSAVCALTLGLAMTCSVRADDRPSVDFSREVRPILSDHCFQCHGPDEKARSSDLRLDTEEGAFAELDGHFAIVAGDPDASALIERVTTEDADLRMPPPDSDQKQLTPEQVEILKQWIAEGAPWQAHWAFVTPVRPDVPESANSDWPVNEIDHFTLVKMREHGFEPSPEASKETLIRRVTLDLTGLPPTVDEVEEFLNDDSPDAYESLVDRLLRSPRYGEHMTRYWLDVARYGDTHGLHLDNKRSIWKYREWLIDAFNENKPFDQMTVEQLAGDLLPDPDVMQVVATGFNRCNVSTSEGGSIAEECYVRNTVDRVETFSTVYLGLTMGCSVCHDHKFDPLTQREFYGLFAYFNSFDENPLDGNAELHPPIIAVPSVEQSTRREELDAQLAAVKQEIDQAYDSLEYSDPHPDADETSFQQKDFVWIDDAVPTGGNQQQTGHPWEFVKAPEPVHSGEVSSKRTAEGLAQHFFTGATSPLVIGEGDTLFAHVYLDAENPPKQIMLQFNDGTWEHRAYWGENVIPWGEDGQPSRKRIGDLPSTGEWVRLEVSVSEVGLVPGSQLNGWAFTQHDGTVYWDTAGINTRTPQNGQSFESQRLWELAVGEGKGLPEPIQKALKVVLGERSDEQQRELRRYFLKSIYPGSREMIQPIAARQEELEKQLETLNGEIPKTMVAKELTEPKAAFFLNRGEYDNKGEEVPRILPAVLPPLPEGAPTNRLGLAQWLVDPSHPLTTRVAINRWWQRYFGTGIVKTAEDFGVQGERPSHPELLDWLATEFIRTGWDVKALQKLIVMSATYRQTSQGTPEQWKQDPDNRWLARGPRFRMDAEMLRDQALYVSGLLVEKPGGPSVKPYQPAGLWEAVGYTDSNTAKFAQDDGSNLYRRTMYTFWKRTSPPPSMATFDAPSRESCTVRRARTNTPLQALVLMNDKQFVEASRHFAQRILNEGGELLDEQLSWGFQSVTSRVPSEQELQVLKDIYTEQLATFEREPATASEFIDSATTLLKPNHLERDKSQDPQLAAMTLLANLLLNLDESVTKG